MQHWASRPRRCATAGFVPLVEEDYFLVCLADALEQPAVRLLCKLLQAPDWRQALQDLDGYACAPMAGEVLSLTRALPWWTFRAPKAAEPPSDRHADAP